MVVPVDVRETWWDPELPADGVEIRLHLDGGLSARWPAEADVAVLLARGVTGVRVGWEVDLGRDAERTVRFVAFLRDAFAQGLPVEWSGSAPDELADALVHLPAPAGDSDALERWRERHRFGLFYWRLGPDFVTVKDVRPSVESARFTIDDAPMLAAFAAAAEPGRGPRSQPLADLVAEGIVLELDGWRTLLPYRMRRWPIPFTAV